MTLATKSNDRELVAFQFERNPHILNSTQKFLPPIRVQHKLPSLT